MKLYDRITDSDVKCLPGSVQPGRFLLKQSATLNRHTILEAGELLSTDGSDRCHLADVNVSFVKPDRALEDDFALVADAVTTIARLMSAGESFPTPLLPTAMISEQSDLSELEQLLEEVISAGHLHSISKRPRIDLRYEESVTEVSRARRLTNKTYTHLASHSECWQRQTLSGVQPKRVKAKFSEDDYAIYENLVYARLLDQLDRHLTYRLRQLDVLLDGLSKAMKFSESMDLHYLLSQDIYRLWGDTYSPRQTKKQLEATEKTLDKVKTLLKTVRALKQSGLYLQVPREVRISPTLHRTNILTHDQHYRHLAHVWDALHLVIQKSIRSPAEQLAFNQQLERDYSVYIGLVLRLALSRYGFEKGDSVGWGGHRLHLAQIGLNWLLKVDETVVLELVPWACSFTLPDEVERINAPRVICWPGTELGDNLDQPLTESALRLSPLDLYVVERMGYLVDSTLSKILLADYGKPLSPLPTPVASGCRDISGLDIRGHQMQVITPLSDVDCETASVLFEQHAKPELVAEFKRQLQLVRTLAVCPVCGASAELAPQGKGEFTSHCQSCDTKRYWHRVGSGHWKYQQTLRDEVAFRVNGRRSFELCC